jgi:hypothetical protein
MSGVTLNVRAAALASPFTAIVAAPLVLAVMPPGEVVSAPAVMAASPFDDGAVQLTVACEWPPLAEAPVGAPDRVAEIAALEADDAGPASTASPAVAVAAVGGPGSADGVTVLGAAVALPDGAVAAVTSEPGITLMESWLALVWCVETCWARAPTASAEVTCGTSAAASPATTRMASLSRRDVRRGWCRPITPPQVSLQRQGGGVADHRGASRISD